MEDYNRQNTNQQPYDNQPSYGQPTYNNQPYDNQHYDYNYDQDPYGGGPNKSVRGLKIMIVIMALILAALSAIYFMQVKQMQDDFAIERDTLTRQLTSLISDYDTLKTFNDTLSVHYEGERMKVDSLLETLQKERRLSFAKIKQYKKEMDLMRTVMTGYIRQIDSLNTENKKLVNENSSIRKKILDYRLRAESAEEKSQELSVKVRQGSVLRARDIRLVALSNSDREVTRANRAARLRVDLVLVGNELSNPGTRNVYVRIIGPDGYVLANASNAMFEVDATPITYSAVREVDYQNSDLNVSLFYNGPGVTGGKYQVRIYTDGHEIGSSEILLK